MSGSAPISNGRFCLSILSVTTALCMALSGPSSAFTLTTLYNFKPKDVNGDTPGGSVIRDPATGILYGVTQYGGNLAACNGKGCGTFFSLKPPATGYGVWALKTIVKFDNYKYPGAHPLGPLLLNNNIIYGTTWNGGKTNGDYGTIFKYNLTPPVTPLSFSSIYSFDYSSGAQPNGGLQGYTVNGVYNLIGTTYYGGGSNQCGYGCGTIFTLDTTTNIIWKSPFFYTNGANPSSGGIFDSNMNFYVTAHKGGPGGRGGIIINPSGTAALTLFGAFNNGSGFFPSSSLIFDTNGKTLYGTTDQGGSHGYDGTVYKINPPAIPPTGKTIPTPIASFNFSNGANPEGHLLFDPAGYLYGATKAGGASTQCNGNGCGTIFMLTPPASGQTAWTLNILVNFNQTNGANPYGDLVRDQYGNIYGATATGGANQGGTVFQLSP